MRPRGSNGGTLQPGQGVTSGAFLSPSGTLLVCWKVFTNLTDQIPV